MSLSDLKTFQASSLEKAHGLLAIAVSKVEKWQSLLETEFIDASDVAEYADPKYLSVNSSLESKMKSVRDVLDESMTDLNTLETYIMLGMPQMEDGNNFGVTVQLAVLKLLADVREKMEKQLEDLPAYYQKRADAVDKLGLATTSESETTTDTTSDSTGDKDNGDQHKTSAVIVKESKTTRPNIAIPHYRAEYIYALDIQQFGKLKHTLSTTITNYLHVIDNVLKNKMKLELPKGSSGGNNFTSMY